MKAKQVSLRESLVFLHEYLIESRSKIAQRETPEIKEGKPVTTEPGRQGRPEKTDIKKEGNCDHDSEFWLRLVFVKSSLILQRSSNLQMF